MSLARAKPSLATQWFSRFGHFIRRLGLGRLDLSSYRYATSRRMRRLELQLSRRLSRRMIEHTEATFHLLGVAPVHRPAEAGRALNQAAATPSSGNPAPPG